LIGFVEAVLLQLVGLGGTVLLDLRRILLRVGMVLLKLGRALLRLWVGLFKL